MTDSYRLKDVERRLAEEEATAELGVHLRQQGTTVFVHGEVSSESTRDAVLRRVAALRPEAEVVDRLTCAESTLADPPRTSEELR